MRLRLALLVVLPTLGLIALAAVVVRERNETLREAQEAVETARIVVCIAELDRALGEEALAASSLEATIPAVWRRFNLTEAAATDRQLDELKSDAAAIGRSQAITDAITAIERGIAKRGDLRSGDLSAVDIVNRYNEMRTPLRRILQLENSHQWAEVGGEMAALIALVEARSQQLEERVVVSVAIADGEWGPGQYARALQLATLQRDQIGLARDVTMNDPAAFEGSDELEEIRAQLTVSDDLNSITPEVWTRSSNAELVVVNDDIARENQRIVAAMSAREAEAAEDRLNTIEAVGAAVAVIALGAIALVRRVTRDLNRRLGVRELEAQALEGLVQRDELETTFDVLADLGGRDKQGRPLHRFTHEPTQSDAEPIAPAGSTELWIERNAEADHRAKAAPELPNAISLAVMAQQRTDDDNRLQRRAITDLMTGVHNRFSIMSIARTAVSSGTPTAMVSLDLDDLKPINDRHGHAVGDSIICAIAERLDEWAEERDGDAGRIGGDEFLLVVTQNEAVDLFDLADDLRQLITQPIDHSGTPHRVSASIGAATTRPGATANTVLTDLDDALQVAKQRGTGLVVVSDEQLRSTLAEAELLRESVARAIRLDQFEPWFQPLWSEGGRRLDGFEALVRWRRSDGTIGGPAEFLPMVEELGLLPELDRRVFDAVAAQVQRWFSAGLDCGRVGVNVSSERLEHVGFIEETCRTLESTGCPPSALTIEVTETGLMFDIENNVKRLEKLRALGIKVAADDFGQGYSSLGYLRDLPIDTLKLDRAFVDGIDSSPTNQSIVMSVVSLARSLKLTIVAEGIERPEELAWLNDLDVDRYQGFHLGRPMPAAEASALLDETRESAAARGPMAAWLDQRPPYALSNLAPEEPQSL